MIVVVVVVFPPTAPHFISVDGGLEVGGFGMDLWLGGLQVRLHGQCHLCLILAGSSVRL